MRSDDRWRIRREEDRVYRVRSARLSCDHRCFCYGMRGRPHLVLVQQLTLNLLNFHFIFPRKKHFSLWGKLSFLWNLSWLVEYNRILHASRIFQFLVSYTFQMTWRVLAPDEFRDVSRNLDLFLSSTPTTPAVGSKRNWTWTYIHTYIHTMQMRNNHSEMLSKL